MENFWLFSAGNGGLYLFHLRSRKCGGRAEVTDKRIEDGKGKGNILNTYRL